MEKELKDFTKKYPISRTLRFELVPVGKTTDTIARERIIDIDSTLNEDYKKMKKTIDEYHKDFIESSLEGLKLTGLKQYFDLSLPVYGKRQESDIRALKDIRDNLRKQVAKCFTDRAEYKRLFTEELLKKGYLKNWVSNQKKELFYTEKFNDKYTYFSGYNQNRKNMYSGTEISSSIAYRLVHENFPKHVDNILVYRKIRDIVLSDTALERFAEIARKLKGVTSLDDVFNAEAFNCVLSQKNIEVYNLLVSGTEDEQGINVLINLYNQAHPKERLPKMKKLNKMILSDRETMLPDAFETAGEALDAIKSFYDTCVKGDIFTTLKSTMKMLPSADQNRIYIRNECVNTISQQVYGSYSVIKNAVDYYYRTVTDPSYSEKMEKAKSAKAIEALTKKKDAAINGRKYVSAGYLQDAVAQWYQYCSNKDAAFAGNPATGIAEYFAPGDCAGELFNHAAEIYESSKALLEESADKDVFSQEEKIFVKNLLDAFLELLHFVKPLYVEESEGLDKDPLFYDDFTTCYSVLQNIVPLYNKVRDFATKKPYSTEKIKLYFNFNGNLLNGWTESKTERSNNGTQYGGYLFRRKNGIGEYDYYLAISKDARLFSFDTEVSDDDCSEFERMNYYQPKAETIFGSAYLGERTYKEDKQEMIRVIESHVMDSENSELKAKLVEYLSKNNSGSEEDTATPGGCLKIVENYEEEYRRLITAADFSELNGVIIAALKKTMEGCKRIPGALQVAHKEYSLFTEMAKDIDRLCSARVMQYKNVSNKEFEDAVNRTEKPLYLFKISNKDLSYAEKQIKGERASRGRENLHTMFFKALMSGDQNVYDIGTAEVFFRKQSITYTSEVLEKGHHYDALKDKFSYPIIKDKRYTKDKYMFHLSVQANYAEKETKTTVLNEEVCKFLKNNPDINIIGIDRGERNLLYISMIDRSGNIVRDEQGNLIQYSLNTITGSYKDSTGNEIEFAVPYKAKLVEREHKNLESRKNWDTVEGIRQLKEGYMSQVIYHLSRLMVKHNAIIVMEDLNSGFKNGRKKVERQVYQKFEKALIDKLNYLVFKDVEPHEAGGLYNALQLTGKFTAFKDLTKQNGFLFYIPAWNTSRIDPVTGFVDFLKPKYTTISDAKEFFDKFRKISYNTEEDQFEFSFDYSEFTQKAYGTRTDWTICSVGELRYRFNKKLNNNKGGYERRNVTEDLKELFKEYLIEFTSQADLRGQICRDHPADFFERLIVCLQILLSLRYSCPEDNADFILSPVRATDNTFFSSDAAAAAGLPLPQDADANGAYNIARKGLLVLRKIDDAESTRDWSTKLTNTEWLQFCQSDNE